MKYHAHKWVLTRLELLTGEVEYRVLASWYGGFADGDSWRYGSNVETIVDAESCNEWHFITRSGSFYICDKDCHGMSMLSSGILQKLKEDEHVKSLETVPEDKIKNLVLVTE